MFTSGYKVIRAEYNMSADAADPWGDTMQWWFAIAETLYHHGTDLPDEWEFHDSPMHWDGDYGAMDDYATATVTGMLEMGEASEDDLLMFGNVLTRYATILKNADCDY